MDCSDHPAPSPTGPRFRALLVGHLPTDPPEATLVLAAAAALSGLQCDGTPMPGAIARAPSLRAIADELGLHVGAVRRGAQHLEAAGAVRVDGGVHVDPAALAQRWASHRQRLRLTAEARSLSMRAEPLLLTGLAAAHVDARGQLRLGLGFLGERTGMARRTLQRALERAEDAGALHRWVAPIGGGRLIIALGPSRSGARRASQTGARRGLAEAPEVDERRETAHPPVAKRRTPHREPAHPPSQSGALPPEVLPEVHPDSPSDARARPRDQTPASPAGETRAPARAAAEPAPNAPPPRLAPVPPVGAPPPPRRVDVRAVVEPWVAAFARKGLERLTDGHAPDVAGLIAQLGPAPDIRDANPRREAERRRAFLAERHRLARRVIAWCSSPERLGRWLVRTARWFGVENLGAYLRRASSQGDPGTVLESHTRNQVGQAVEQWRDFTPATERALQGEHVVDVGRLVVAGAAILDAEAGGALRERLREQLRALLGSQRRAAARAVLLKLVGSRPSDVALARATEGILTLPQAKELLAA